MSNKEFTIREYKDTDLTGVLDLWECYSGWGRPETEEYERWMKTPFGDCIVLVAENKKDLIIGQLVLTPTELVIYGKNQNALKLSAPIIHEDYRYSNILERESLMIQIFLKAYQIVQKKDFDWFYSFPAAGWSKIMGLTHRFGLGPWKINFYEGFEIIDNNIKSSDFSLQVLDEFPDEISIIWEQFKVQNKDKSFVTRDLEWLKYKWGDDLKVGIYDSTGKLDGYAVIKKQSGLILDFILLSSNEIPAVLTKLKQLFDNHLRTEDVSSPGLKFMKNSLFSEKLDGVVIQPVDFQFLFGLSALKDFEKLEKTNFTDWYVFPND